MKQKRNLIIALLCALFMGIMILDAKTACCAAQEAVELCIKSVIPSLFPFFVLSILLNQALSGTSIALFRPFLKACGIPYGGESILLAALLGGYPVGAKCVYEAYQAGSISRYDAKRLLGFCNNAGPAFIFGIMSSLFSSFKEVLLLWIVHVLSAITVGLLLPKVNKVQSQIIATGKKASVTDALSKSIRAISSVCAWVCIFRVIITFFEKWFLWMLPEDFAVMITGALELTNGCFALQNLSGGGLRFILGSVFVSFGGVCVGMQTCSVTEELGTGLYFPGKILQVVATIFYAVPLQYLLYDHYNQWKEPDLFLPLGSIIILGCTMYFTLLKKSSSIPKASIV